MNTVINAQYIAEALPNSQHDKIFLYEEDGVSWTVSEMERYKLNRKCNQFDHTQDINYRQFHSPQDRDEFVELALTTLDNSDLITCDFSTLLRGVTIDATINSSGAGHFITSHELIASNVLAITFLDKSHESKRDWWTVSNTVMSENIDYFLQQLEQAGATVNRRFVKKFAPVQLSLESNHLFVQCDPIGEPMHCALVDKHACFSKEFALLFRTSSADYNPANRKSTPVNWNGTIQVPFNRVRTFLADLSSLSIPFISEQDLNRQQLIQKATKTSSNCDKNP